MSRGLHQDTIAALATNEFDLATLVQFDFSTVLRLTNWGRDVVALSNTFVSSADLLSVDGIEETGEVRVNEFSLEMSGVGQEYISIFLNNEFVNVRMRLWQAILNDDQVIGDPISLFDGRISGMSIDENETSSTVSIQAASHWKDFERRAGRKTNPTSQNSFFSADLGMEFAQDLKRDIAWGRR